MRAAWFNCFAGVAGDMALGALIDAGADLSYVRSSLQSLAVGDWTLDVERTQRAGIAASRIVITGAEDDTVSRTFRTIRALLTEADLPIRVRNRSLAVFTRLAEVEARMHSTDVDHVHFHEVGGVDAILDIVGTCLALEQLGVDEVHCSPITTGYGTVEAAHGLLPVPAPAVIALLKGAPTTAVDRQMEMTTPTGAALMTTLATGFGPMPALAAVDATGYGAGSRDLAGMPNCTQVVLGTLSEAPDAAQPAVVIEANVDDVTGEVLAHALNALMAAGAHDAWITPIVMKKGRPAHTVSVLCDEARVAEITTRLIAETGSFGVRTFPVDKGPALRHMESMDFEGHTLRFKVGGHRTKVEFDDAAALAAASGRPVREVIAAAEAAWQAAHS